MKTIRTIASASAFILVMIAASSSGLFAATAEFKPVAAPSFSAVTIDGRQISSTSLKGKAYIVNFFATWCPPCRAEIPDMVVLQKTYAAKGFTFIGIAVNENEPNVKSFIKSNAITYPVAMSTPALVSTFSKYVDGGISGIPTSFVIDSSGRLIDVMVGGRNREVFEKTIKASLGSRTK